MHHPPCVSDTVIFEEYAPIRRQCVFDAAAKQQARECAGGAGKDTFAVREGEGEAAHRDAGLAVEEPAVDDDARPRRKITAPNQIRGLFYRCYRRTALVDAIDDARPRRLALNPGDERADLIIATELSAGETAGGLRKGIGVAAAQNERVGEGAAAAMSAGVAPSPVACRKRCLVNRRFDQGGCERGSVRGRRQSHIGEAVI